MGGSGNRMKKTSTTRETQLNLHPRVVTTAYGKKRLQQFQAHLFRRTFDETDTPKIINANHLTRQMSNKRF